MTNQRAVAQTAWIESVSAQTGQLACRDISGLSHADLLAEYDAVAKLGRLADALEARYAGEISRRSTPDQAGGGLARRQGFGHAGAMVAAVTGGSATGAWRSIEAGRAFIAEPVLLPDPSQPNQTQPDPAPLDAAPLDQAQPPAPRYPAITTAAVAGNLSTDAAAILTAGLESLTDRVPSDQLHALEKRLVDKAMHLAVKDVRRLVAHAVARADLPGHMEREKHQHADRYLSWTEDHTGMVTLTGRLDAVTAAPLRTVIEQMVTHQFHQRRDQDPTNTDQRNVGQLRADALHDLARHALGCKNTNQSGVRTTIIVRMNLSDLNTGDGLGTIDGTAQPISVGELRRLAGEADIIPQVLGSDSEVLDQGRNVRMFTKAQRLALLERDGGCAKCHAPPEHCEAHHITWWEHGGHTDLNNGVMLCTRCHHDIHRQHWGIQTRNGTVELIPPPQIDPLQQPRLGGLAALTLNEDDDDDDDDDADRADPPDNTPRENSTHKAA